MLITKSEFKEAYLEDDYSDIVDTEEVLAVEIEKIVTRHAKQYGHKAASELLKVIMAVYRVMK